MLKPVNGFFGHIRKNHTRSLFMFAGFAVSMQVAFAALLALPLTFSKNYEPVFSEPAQYFYDFGFIIFIVSAILFLASYLLHTSITRLTTGFNYVESFRDNRLENIVKNLAWTAGIPVPEIGIIETNALNSFACGLSQDKATLVVTRGLIDELDDDELQAVVAHEIVHIMNGDIGMMAAANASHSIIKLVNWLNPFQVRNGGLLESRGSGCLMFILWPILIPLIITLALVGFAISLSSMIAGVTRYFVTSSREFIADAEAVRLTHNPAALISALSKIEGRSLIPHLDKMSNAMMIDGPVDGELASHPPIMDRVQALLQYGGSMVHGAGIRKDTRGFGRRNAPAPHEAEIARYRYRNRSNASVVSRVSADRDTTIFNIPEGVLGRVFGIGIAMFMVMNFNKVMTFSAMDLGNSKPASPKRVKAVIEPSPIYIVFDLDGDGLETVGVNQSRTYIDFDKDARSERTGWLGADDGFLFHDKNRNKKLDLPGELIMSDVTRINQVPAMHVLNRFDTDYNGRIDRSDRRFSELRIWRDLGRAGKPEGNDTYSLSALGIQRIELRNSSRAKTEKKILASGGTVYAQRVYKMREDGPKRHYHDNPVYLNAISFETDITRYKNENGQVERMSYEEYAARFETPKSVSGEIGPSIESVNDQINVKTTGEKQNIAEILPDSPKNLGLRGRQKSD